MLKDLLDIFESLKDAVTSNMAVFCIYTMVISSLSFVTFLMLTTGHFVTGLATASIGGIIALASMLVYIQVLQVEDNKN